LSASVADGPASLVLGPFLVLGIILDAIRSAGSGLLAPIVLLVGQFAFLAWDRSEAGERRRLRQGSEPA